MAKIDMVNHSGKGLQTLTPEARAQARQAEMYHHSTLIFRASTVSVRNSTLVFRPLTKPSICAQARQAEMYHQAMADAGGHAGPYTPTPTFDCEVLCFKGFGADQQEFSKMQMMNYLKKCPSILTPSP